MATEITTYATGYKLKFTKNVTKSDYIKICNKLTEHLNEEYKNNNKSLQLIQIYPELVSEGGLFFKGNDYKDPKYKSFRHHIDNIKWSMANYQTIMTDWENNNEIFINAKSSALTCLKAFGGAPRWTVKELSIFKNVFSEFGITCGRMPSDKKLDSVKLNNKRKFIND